MRGGKFSPKLLVRYFTRRLLPLAVCAAAVARICLVLLPRLADSDIRPYPYRYGPYMTIGAIDRWLIDSPEILQRTEPEIVTWLAQRFQSEPGYRSFTPNEFTGGELKAEDSPGNLTVEKQAAKILVRVYDRYGTPFVKTYPIGIDLTQRRKAAKSQDH